MGLAADPSRVLSGVMSSRAPCHTWALVVCMQSQPLKTWVLGRHSDQPVCTSKPDLPTCEPDALGPCCRTLFTILGAAGWVIVLAFTAYAPYHLLGLTAGFGEPLFQSRSCSSREHRQDALAVASSMLSASQARTVPSLQPTVLLIRGKQILGS